MLPATDVYCHASAYYNAGSAALVLVLIAVLVGGFWWWRHRRSRLRGLPGSTENTLSFAEENIPLTESNEAREQLDDEEEYSSRKGKERATSLSPKEEIFRVDDSDDEDHDGSARRNPRS